MFQFKNFFILGFFFIMSKNIIALQIKNEILLAKTSKVTSETLPNLSKGLKRGSAIRRKKVDSKKNIQDSIDLGNQDCNFNDSLSDEGSGFNSSSLPNLNSQIDSSMSPLPCDDSMAPSSTESSISSVPLSDQVFVSEKAPAISSLSSMSPLPCDDSMAPSSTESSISSVPLSDQVFVSEKAPAISSLSSISPLPCNIEVSSPIITDFRTINNFINFFNNVTPYMYASLNGRDREKNDKMNGIDQLVRVITSAFDYNLYKGQSQWKAYCNDNVNSAIAGGIHPNGNKNILGNRNIFDFNNIKKDFVNVNPSLSMLSKRQIESIAIILQKIIEKVNDIKIGHSKHHSGIKYWKLVEKRKKFIIEKVLKFQKNFFEAIDDILYE